MLTACSIIWDANGKSRNFSKMYDESWVVKLFNGFDRHLTLEHRNVLYTDRKRDLPDTIEQVVVPGLGRRGYAECIRPFEMGCPMIFVGLDTIITGNIDKLGKWCLEKKVMCLPRDPYNPHQAINGVCLIPEGYQRVAREHRGENDMVHVRKYRHRFIDDEMPGYVRSYKGHVEKHGLGDTRIVYFHGLKKPHELQHVEWIREHWQ